MGHNLINDQEVLTCDDLIVTNDLVVSTSSNVFVVWMPPDTRMLFQSEFAPSGWQKITSSTAIESSAVISTNGTVTNGGSSSVQIDTHRHQFGTHTHSLSHTHGLPAAFDHNHAISGTIARDDGGISRVIDKSGSATSTGRVWAATGTSTKPTSSTTLVSTTTTSSIFAAANIKYLHTIVCKKL